MAIMTLFSVYVNTAIIADISMLIIAIMGISVC